MAIGGKSLFYFLMRNRTPIHPDVTLNGLLLYYDMRGKTNDDDYRAFILDMSGNDNNAELAHFRFDDTSGYTDGLEFNDYSNRLHLPKLDLSLSRGFNLQINNHIYNHSPSNGLTTVRDGKVSPAADYPPAESVYDQLFNKQFLEGNFLIDSGYYQTETGELLREDLVIHSLKIYNRPLTNNEMLKHDAIENELFYRGSIAPDSINRTWTESRWRDHPQSWTEFVSG